MVTFTFPCNEHTSGDWLDCMKFPSWSSSNYMQGSKDQVNVRRNKKTFWVLTHSIIYISKIWMKRDLANKMHISAFNIIFLKILRIIFSFSSTSAVWLQRFSQTSIRLHNPNGIKWHYIPNIIFITYQNSVICCVLSIGSSPPPETQTSSTGLTCSCMCVHSGTAQRVTFSCETTSNISIKYSEFQRYWRKNLGRNWT